MTGYVLHSFNAAKETIKGVQQTLDAYWTPFNGHKVSARSTREKLKDLLIIADSGRKTASSEEEDLEWFILECQLLDIQKHVG